MYRSLFPRDIFAELDRLQRDMSGVFDYSPSIRGFGRGGYPALNVGSTPTSVEIYAFAPGIDPAAVEINLDRGVLTIDGERKATLDRGGKWLAQTPQMFRLGLLQRALAQAGAAVTDESLSLIHI